MRGRIRFDPERVAAMERGLIDALRRSMGIPPNPSHSEVDSLTRCLSAVHPIRNRQIDIAECREAARAKHLNQLRGNHG